MCGDYRGQSENAVASPLNYNYRMVDPQVWEDINNCRDPKGDRTLGRIDLSEVPEPIRTTLWDRVKDLAGQPMSNCLMTQLRTAQRASDPQLRYWMRHDPADPKTWLLSFHVGSPFPPPQGNAKRWRRFPEGDAPRLSVPYWEPRAIQRVEPEPVPGCSGTVTLDVLIGTDGHVAEAYVDEGPEPLREAALHAARQWTFRTYAEAGHAFEVQTRLRLEFPAVPTEQPAAQSDK
jgi:hypothetical protein